MPDQLDASSLELCASSAKLHVAKCLLPRAFVAEMPVAKLPVAECPCHPSQTGAAIFLEDFPDDFLRIFLFQAVQLNYCSVGNFLLQLSPFLPNNSPSLRIDIFLGFGCFEF